MAFERSPAEMAGSSGRALPAGHRSLVIGGAGALGRAICRVLAGAGAHVRTVDLDPEAARAACASLPGDGHTWASGDVSTPGGADEIAAAAFVDGPLDSMVYAAGVVDTADVVAIDWERYRQLMAVNLDGAFFSVAAVGRHLLALRRPSAITVLSSTAGRRGEAGAAAYCASKFGVLGLVESFAAEVGLAGIRVNAVCPGNVESPMLERVAGGQARRTGTSAGAVLESYAREAPMRRLVQPDEVARAVLWLTSPAASAVTGVALTVDGGAWIG